MSTGNFELKVGEMRDNASEATFRPVLTLPETEAAFLRSEYLKAETILEYGSGGSTVMGAELENKRVFSVESDGAWAENLRRYLGQSDNCISEVTLHHVDLGPTKRWGIPKSDKNWRSYWRYPLDIYSHEQFKEPDLVFVDGIYRPACVVAAMFMLKKPARLVFDDYLNPRTNWTTTRPRFEGLEKFIKPVKFIGRMAVFEIEPKATEPELLLAGMPFFFRYF